MDPERLARLFQVVLQLIECLSKMQPEQRQKVLQLTERLSGQKQLAADVEALVSGE